MLISEYAQVQDDTFLPVFYQIRNPNAATDLTQQVRSGVTHIYEGKSIPEPFAKESLFFLHVHPQTAFNIDLTLLLRTFCNRNPDIRFKDQDMALTAIFEGWSNALLWGTLEMPNHKGRSRIPEFDSILREQLSNPFLALRFITLAIKRRDDKVRVYIRDQGVGTNFSWDQSCARSQEDCRGLAIINNCSDGVAFDEVHKVLRMEFHLV
ncbi:MAG: hypothetical protein WCG04_05485 [Alphaproteobacteria bacterium]